MLNIQNFSLDRRLLLLCLPETKASSLALFIAINLTAYQTPVLSQCDHCDIHSTLCSTLSQSNKGKSGHKRETADTFPQAKSHIQKGREGWFGLPFYVSSWWVLGGWNIFSRHFPVFMVHLYRNKALCWGFCSVITSRQDLFLKFYLQPILNPKYISPSTKPHTEKDYSEIVGQSCTSSGFNTDKAFLLNKLSVSTSWKEKSYWPHHYLNLRGPPC